MVGSHTVSTSILNGAVIYVEINAVTLFDLPNIMLKLKKVVRWRDVALHLGVPKHVADRIEQDHRGDTERQKMEAISWWLDNAKAASWWGLSVGLRKADYNTLAGTVENLAVETDASG